MSSYVLDHGTPRGTPTQVGFWKLPTGVWIFEQRSGNGRIWSTDIFLSGALPFRRACRGHLFGVAGNGKQHFALSLNPFAPFVRRSGCDFFLCNAPAERVHEVYSILRQRRGMLPRYRYAGLFLLEHLDHGFLIVIHKLRGVEVRRLALEDVLGQLEHIRLDLYVRDV